MDTDALKNNGVVTKIKAAIEKLREQNEQLKHDLLLENKFSVRPGDPYAQALINRLQDEGDMLARKIVMEMRKAKMLDMQLGESSNLLTQTRSTMGGMYAARESVIALQMKTKLLENRLEKAYVKYNQSVTHNKQLRDQIDNLRREKIMFLSIDATLERELAKLKKSMAETIQLANVAFEAKEKAVAEMNVLKLQAEKEMTSFEEEWRQLTSIIEEDKRERERQRQRELASRERETQELLKMGTAAMDKSKKRSASRGTNYNQALEQNVAAEKVAQYTRAFEQIQGATGIEDIDTLVNTFVTAEDQNYTLFNYVNEVNAEIEKLEDQISGIRAESDKYKTAGEAWEMSKTMHIHSVEDKLAAAAAQEELYRTRFDRAKSTVESLKLGISSVFADIGCDTPLVRQVIGDTTEIADQNMLAYLGLIEQRVTELLKLHALARRAEGVAVPSEVLVAQPLTTLSNRVVIEPPSTHNEEEIEGMEPEPLDDDRPLSRGHLTARVNKTLPRKLETAIKVRPPGQEPPVVNKKAPMRR